MHIFHKALLISAISVAGTGQALADEYRLGAQDKVSISVYEYPSLTGTFVVGPSGSIGMPMIGNIAVDGRSADAVGALIGQELARVEKLGDLPKVSVQIVEFRPYYVVGNVQRPGRYAYEPGLTILKAIGSAGGMFRPADPDVIRLGRDATNAEGMIRTSEIDAAQLQIRIERLTAERTGAKEFAPALEGRAGNPDMLGSFIQQQQQVFNAKRQLLSGQVDALGKLAKVYRAEAASLREQIRLKGIEVKTAQARLDSDDKLAKLGATSAAVTLDRERLLANLRGEEEALRSMVLRAEQGVTQSEQSMLNLVDTRKRDDAQELHNAEVEYFQTHVKIRTAKALLNEAVALAPEAYRQLSWELQQVPSYRVVRKVDGRTIELPADENDNVVAGDVIKVSRPELSQ